MTNIFDLGHPHIAPPHELVQLLGAKGAGLATMTSVLDLPVPPGFTIATTATAELASSSWPPDLEAELRLHIARLERTTGKRLGDPSDPLIVSVRSGSAVSMPGMLDTVLEVGLDDIAVEGLAASTGDKRFAYDCFSRFLASYGTCVMGVDAAIFEAARAGVRPASPAGAVELCHLYQRSIARATGSSVPREAYHQVRTAIEAVASSWHSPRARTYRSQAGFLADGATAVTVQLMVHGNRDAESCAGVAFSRSPLTGAPEPFGEVIFEAQGDDVMSGARDVLGLAALEERLPDAHAGLLDAIGKLEEHHRDICEVEMTVEQGELWLLQSRVAERSPAAAVRAAVDMALQDGWRISEAEAVDRVSNQDLARLRQLSTVGASESSPDALTRGLPASAGVATGLPCTTVERCLELTSRGESVILVRPTTSPADVMGLRVSAGVLTATGGPASHAAVVARAWGIPAVVGASAVSFGPAGAEAELSIGATTIDPGEVITIDGNTGDVFLGAPPDARPVPPPPELETLLAWRADPGDPPGE